MTNLTLAEKLIFRDIKRAAIIWLLILRLDPAPITETKAAKLLAIDSETARKYLATLNEHNIVTRLSRFGGYVLTDTGRQLALPSELSEMAKAGIPPSGSNTSNNLKNLEEESLSTSVLLLGGERGNPALEGEKTALAPKNEQPVDNPVDKIVETIMDAEPEKQAVLTALLAAGIAMNHRTVKLLASDTITAINVKSQHAALIKRGRGEQTGILITNLESKYRIKGADLNSETGHLAECACSQCVRTRNDKFSTWKD